MTEQAPVGGRREDDRTGWHADPRRGPERVRVAGLEIEATSLREAVDQVEALVATGELHLVVTVNVDQSLHARDRPQVREAFRSASRRYADGMPVVLLARLLGVHLPGRVTGADLLPALCAAGARRGHRIAIVGGAEGVAQTAAANLTAQAPGLQVVLTLSPPLGFEHDPEHDGEVVKALVDAQPHLVFVCLGSPKQELWVHDRQDVLPPAVYLGVGAAVDFAAGHVPRAPELYRRAGLEWLFRLQNDFGRLWRRYLVNDPRFLRVAAEDLLRKLLRRS